MKIHSKIDIGKVRNSNQDAFFVGEIAKDTVVAIVCDGMGGANAGNVASEMAVKLIFEYIANSFRNKMSLIDISNLVKNAVKSVNIEIFETASKNSALSGMGTTAVIAIVTDKSAVIANVGDSRAYLVNNKISQITRDHSIVQTLIESGKITEADAKVHPRKNVITRAIGAEDDVAVDCDIIDLSVGDSLLLCTDGLSNFVDEADILKTFKKNDISKVADKLVTLANANGGGDNITVVTVTVWV